MSKQKLKAKFRHKSSKGTFSSLKKTKAKKPKKGMYMLRQKAMKGSTSLRLMGTSARDTSV